MCKALCFLLALFSSGEVLAKEPARDPRIGAWIQKAGPDSLGVRQSFEDIGEGRIRLRLSGLIVDARCDGRSYPFKTANGGLAGPTYACRIVGPNTVEYAYTQDGRRPWTTSVGAETVSEGGSTLIHVGVRRDAEGNVVENLRQEYRRLE